MEGRRPLLAELQALVVPSVLPAPRRTVHGLDSGRVSMVLAVLERRCRVAVGSRDVYASTVGGAKVSDPSADLAVAIAIASAATNTTLAPRTLALGEVGLAGELRRVPGTDRRLAEAARLGFTDALVPTRDDDRTPRAGRRPPARHHRAARDPGPRGPDPRPRPRRGRASTGAEPGGAATGAARMTAVRCGAGHDRRTGSTSRGGSAEERRRGASHAARRAACARARHADARRPRTHPARADRVRSSSSATPT